MTSNKRKCLTLEQKVEVIKFYETNKSSVRNIAEKYGVGKTQISEILKNKSELMNSYFKQGNVQRKRKFAKTEGCAIDDILFDWFCKTRNKNVPLSGPIIKEKALEVAQELNIKFAASNGWLEKFCRRHNIKFKQICGESAFVDQVCVDEWKEKLKTLIKDYEPRNIYNADETGLFFRALPSKTFALKNEKCSGGKSAKERITILFCANMAGEKEDPLIIGKYRNPRCFKGSNIEKLPLKWTQNKKAWMTRDIMVEWLHKFDQKMGKQRRNIILFLDNAPSHPTIDLKNIKLFFLPPNTTSHCQPLDRGIIRNFKVFYRGFIVKRLMTLIDSETSLDMVEKKITLVNTLIWTVAAWKKVSSETIKNCFNSAGFSNNIHSSQDFIEFEEEDNIPLSKLFSLDTELPSNIATYSEIDDGLLTENLDCGGIKDCIADYMEKDGNDNSDADDLDEDVPTTVMNTDDACKKLNDIENFFINKGNLEIVTKISTILSDIEKDIVKHKLRNLKQRTLDDYFL